MRGQGGTKKGRDRGKTRGEAGRDARANEIANDRDPRKRPETGGLRREGKRPAQNHFMIAIQLQQRVFSAHLHIFSVSSSSSSSSIVHARVCIARVCTRTHARTQSYRKAQNLAAFGIVLGSHYNHGRICKVPVCRSPLSNDTVAAGVCVQERGRGVLVIFYFHGVRVAIRACGDTCLRKFSALIPPSCQRM
jgi:hypothetical protein